MSSEADLSDASLIELFRSEVETHAEVLNTALLALERAPGDTSRINEMMRAAHSIKGASRIVDVDPAGRVAHVMEDCFVAAQKGTIRLSSGDVDVLLRGVDLLEKISEGTKDPEANLEQMFGDLVHELLNELQAVLTGRHESRPVPGTSTPTPISAPPATVPPPLESTAHAEPAATLAVGEITIAFPAILDSVAAEEMRQRLLVAIDSQMHTIGFDLRATRELDVRGLAFLAAVPRHLESQRRSPPRLAGVSTEMATVLRVTGLDESYGAVRGVTPKAD